MINAKGIKITTHLLKPLPPPREPIFLHPFPIVSGKPPVLSLDGKIIRRGPGLHAHTIQVGFYPRVTTITMYPNRNVALQNNAFFMCIIRSFFQLKMQMVLNKIMKSYVAKCLWARGRQFFNVSRVVDAVRFPLVKMRRTIVFIPEITKGSIRSKPMLIVFKEMLVLFTFKTVLP